ncbi:hypothetical protein MLD38_015382 [Melastoma candidum]|uniref:Uncharacterized protein n=1 Tax=Melastoma candidum TaxID=119954 RepID=A0ACB9RHA3_9MYRT|nr:hypothetical protein MLD38_015382 [Melastoma candidum]
MSSSQLNSDLNHEILSRVSLCMLGRCRLVNKEWNQITHEPNVVSLHSSRTGTLRGYLISSSRRKDTAPVTFEPTMCTPSKNHRGDTFSPGFVQTVGGRSVTVEASHMGIVLCLRDGPRKHHRVPQYLICKPSTGQWAVIPNPRTRSETMLFSLAVLRSEPTLRFKILRVSRNRQTCANYVHSSFRCEVFNSDLWEWRRLKDIRLPVDYFGLCIGDGVIVSGNSYAHTKYPDGIFAFDMLNDTWEVMWLPFGELGQFEQVELVKIEGRLGIVRQGWDMNVLEIWVMEDRCNKVWRQRRKDLTVEDDPGAVKDSYFGRTTLWPEKILRFCSDLEPVDFGPAH